MRELFVTMVEPRNVEYNAVDTVSVEFIVSKFTSELFIIILEPINVEYSTVDTINVDCVTSLFTNKVETTSVEFMITKFAVAVSVIELVVTIVDPCNVEYRTEDTVNVDWIVS